MRTLVILLAVLLFITGALAQIDDGINSFGIYFDEGATIIGIETPTNPIDIYLSLVNPSVEAVGGFGLDLHVETMEGFPGYWVPFGPSHLLADGSMVTQGDNMGVAFASPIAVTGPIMPLMRTTGASFAVVPGVYIFFSIRPGTAGPPSQIGIIALLDGNGNVIAGQDSAHGGVCAYIGELVGFAVEDVSFGDIKALYR